jgi:hypothetical protein
MLQDEKQNLLVGVLACRTTYVTHTKKTDEVIKNVITILYAVNNPREPNIMTSLVLAVQLLKNSACYRNRWL